MGQRRNRGRAVRVQPFQARRAAVPCAAMLTLSAGAGIVTSTWTGPAVGTWTTASNWSPFGVPQNGGGDLFDVVIDGNARQSSSVTLTGDIGIQSLLINDGDALTISNASVLRLSGGSLTNDGTMHLNSAGNSTDLFANADLNLGGGGQVTASATQANRIYGASSAVRLTHGSGHLIRGSLNLGANQMRLTNAGEVRADSLAGLTIDLTDGAGLNFNSGVFRATSGAPLTILGSSIDNTGGLIEAATGSFVNLNNAAIIGGTLLDADGSGVGQVRNISIASLEDVTVQGPFTTLNATATSLRGTIDVQGSLVLASQGNATDVIVSTSPFTLAGSGETFATNTQANRLYGISSATALTIAPEHLVRGSLTLGANQLRLTNQGEVRADAIGGLSIDLSDGAGVNFNSGEFRATAGATLTIQGSSIDNTGGLIEAEAGSFVNLSNAAIIGGVLLDADGAGAGQVRTISTATIENVTVQGPFTASNATQTTLRGTIDIQGTLLLASQGNTTDVIVATSPFTLAGSGDTFATNTQANRFYGLSTATTVTIAAEHLVHGSLLLGENQMRLVNQGEVRADTSAGITMDLSDGAGFNFNSGELRASNGATLAIQGSSINNTGGLLEAEAGSFVNLNNTAIVGGTLLDSDGNDPGQVRTVTSATLESVTVQGPFTSANATQTTLRGTIDIQGSLVLGSAGNTTDVIIATTPFTLGGSGETIATNTQANRLYGVNPNIVMTIAPQHTLRGSLVLGANQLGIVNQGTILADASSGIAIDPTDGIGFVNNGLLHLTGGSVSIASGAFDTTGSVLINTGRTLSRTGVYTQTDGLTRVDGSLNASSGVAILGGTLMGNGSVTSPVVNTGGAVAPGASAGILSLTAGYTQQPGGTLSIEIGGTTAGSGYDRLAITGNAALAGSLTVARIGGFVPLPGDVFTVLTCTGTRTGEFSAVTSCDNVSVTYTANAVLVQFLGISGIPGDVNNDGLVNGADIALVLGNWGPCSKSCCTGDLDGNGIVNGADLAIVLGNWTT